MNSVNKKLNDEKNIINWFITKFDVKNLIKLPFFPYRSEIKEKSINFKKYIGGQEQINSLFVIPGPGGSGKTNFLISLNHMFGSKILFGKNIKSLEEIDKLKNEKIICIDAVNEITNISLESFFKKLSEFKRTIVITYRFDIQEKNKEILHLINKYFSNNYIIIDTFFGEKNRSEFSYDRLDLSKLKDVTDKLAFLLIKKILVNKRNLYFLYSLIINDELHTNEKSIIHKIRDLIEQTFKNKGHKDLWNKLKKSKYKNNIFNQLTNQEINDLIKCDFVYRDNKFDLEEVIHKLIDTAVWADKGFELSEYARAFIDLKRGKIPSFTDFKNYLLFYISHNEDVQCFLNFKSFFISNDEMEYCLFFKNKKLNNFFLSNVSNFINFYKNFTNKQSGLLNDFIESELIFNETNYLFLFCFCVSKDEELSTLATKRFLIFFKKCKNGKRSIIIKNLQLLILKSAKLFKTHNNYKYYYLYSRFCFLYRLINKFFYHFKLSSQWSNHIQNGLKCIHSYEGMFNNSFKLDIKKDTYFHFVESLDNNWVKLNLVNRHRISKHLNYYFDQHIAHNRPLMKNYEIAHWNGEKFLYWLNNEPLFNEITLDPKSNFNDHLGLWTFSGEIHEPETFSDDKEAYIIDVMYYMISIPKKRSTLDVWCPGSKGYYEAQDNFVNIPYYVSEIIPNQLRTNYQKNLEFHDFNVITYEKASLLKRLAYSIKKIEKLKRNKKIIFFEELVGDSNVFNLDFVLSYSNEMDDINNNWYFNESEKRFCYTHYHNELCFYDPKAKYIYDNLHNEIVVSKNKQKYRNFKWFLSFCNEKYWIDIMNVNNQCRLRAVYIVHGHEIEDIYCKYNDLIKTFKNLLRTLHTK